MAEVGGSQGMFQRAPLVRAEPRRALFRAVLAGLVVLAVLGFTAYVKGSDASKQADLGVAILSGAIIGLAILGAEYLVDQRERHLSELVAEWDRRQNLIQTISMNTDLTGIDLSGLNLDGLYLRGKKLNGANLVGVSLRGADLTNAQFRDALLIGADLSDAILAGTSFESAVMYAVDLSGATTRPGTGRQDSGVGDSLQSSRHLSDAEVRRIAQQIGYAGAMDEARHWFEELYDRRATFDRALLLAATLDGAELIGASFAGADLSGASLRNTNLVMADLSNVRIRQQVTASRAKRVERTLERFRNELADERLTPIYDDARNKCGLSGFDLPPIVLTGARLNAASLRSAEFAPEADLSTVNEARVLADHSTKWPRNEPPDILHVEWDDGGNPS